MQTRFLFSTLLVTFIFLQGHTQGPPPPTAMPNGVNTVFIDSIIEVSHYEAYFTKYCTEKIKTYAAENKWSVEKTSRVLASIKFKYFSSMVYNSYAQYSTDDLKKLIDVLERLNRNSNDWTSMTLTNYMMQSNLDSFIKMVLQEKYITN